MAAGPSSPSPYQGQEPCGSLPGEVAMGLKGGAEGGFSAPLPVGRVVEESTQSGCSLLAIPCPSLQTGSWQYPVNPGSQFHMVL